MTKQNDNPLKLDAFLPYQLSVLTNKISRTLADYYSQEFDLTIPEWRVLAVLGGGERLSAVEIADRTQMDKVAVSRAIGSLLEGKRVSRQFMRQDKRCSQVGLSKAGLMIYQQIVPKALAYQAALMSVLSPAELNTLKVIIQKLSDCLATEALFSE